jgi:hypothetical protein
MKISYEILKHFQCSACDMWWSIGDAPIGTTKHWFCPWCGFKHDVPEEHTLNLTLSEDDKITSR